MYLGNTLSGRMYVDDIQKCLYLPPVQVCNRILGVNKISLPEGSSNSGKPTHILSLPHSDRHFQQLKEQVSIDSPHLQSLKSSVSSLGKPRFSSTESTSDNSLITTIQLPLNLYSDASDNLTVDYSQKSQESRSYETDSGSDTSAHSQEHPSSIDSPRSDLSRMRSSPSFLRMRQNVFDSSFQARTNQSQTSSAKMFSYICIYDGQLV